MSAPILRTCGLAIALAFLAAGPFTGFAAETLTYTDLVGRLADMAVSYTHLTLPTKRIV